MKSDDVVQSKMEALRLEAQTEIPISQQKIDVVHSSFLNSTELIKDKARQTVQDRVKLSKLKVELREAEDEFVKAVSVKTRKEAKRMAVVDSLSATKVRIEELKRIVQEQRTKKDERARIISQQSPSLAKSKGKRNQDNEKKEHIQEVISWYNKVLGFRIECGIGIKFIFTSINMRNPNEEYSFTIRHSNDNYTLLDCDPYLDHTAELISELNRTNGLFKFVRLMREKFMELAASGSASHWEPVQQVSSTISLSAPSPSVSAVSESSVRGKENRVSTRSHGREGKMSILSPRSALLSSPVRRSPRFVKAKK